MCTLTTTAAGRFRGVSAGGSLEMAASLRSRIEPIKDQHIAAVSGGDQFRPTASPGGTDSTAFSWIGLNGALSSLTAFEARGTSARGTRLAILGHS
jgi:hypothetical protein